jgi:hypothetical protein
MWSCSWLPGEPPSMGSIARPGQAQVIDTTALRGLLSP